MKSGIYYFFLFSPHLYYWTFSITCVKEVEVYSIFLKVNLIKTSSSTHHTMTNTFFRHPEDTGLVIAAWEVISCIGSLLFYGNKTKHALDAMFPNSTRWSCTGRSKKTPGMSCRKASICFFKNLIIRFLRLWCFFVFSFWGGIEQAFCLTFPF